MPKTKKVFLDGFVHNFNELFKAAQNKDLCLLECLEAKTQKMVAVICAVYVVPLARMLDENPYETLLPPNPDGGFFPVPGSGN